MPLLKSVEIHQGPYRIQQYPGRPVPLELHPKTFIYSNVITWSLWSFYIIFQFRFAWMVQNGSPNLMWRMWVVLFAEVCLSFQDLVLAINTIFALFCAKEARVRPWYRLVGIAAPTIDVCITCCGEPVDVVIDTVTAAAAQDYPSKQFRVFLLDDGHNEILRSAIEAMGKRSVEKNGPLVMYLSRKLEPGIKSYFKAGNLQFGIEETKRLGDSEFLACLDADMIPEPDWLRRIIPHLILEGKLALVCPPQRYYNVPNKDPLGQQAEFNLWFTVFEPLNDRLDAAMCTGSGYIVRRNALADIGGWPLVDAGEDFMCSALLSNAGWKVAFIREDLQFGLAPESLRAHVKQRMRWADSGIEVHKQFGFYLPGSKITSQLTWIQRGVGILQALREYAPVTNILALVLLPMALVPMRHDEFATITLEHDLFWLRSIFLAAFFAQKVNNYIVFGHIGLRSVANFQSNDIWCAPYTAARCILSLLPSTANSMTFEASGSITSSANERSRTRRQPLPYRLLSLDLLMYMLYVIYASTPLFIRFLACVDSNRSSGTTTSIFPFPGPILKLLSSITKIMVPLLYMLGPPTVPERAELMEMDESGIRRPKTRAATATAAGLGFGGENWSWVDVLEIFVIVAVIGC